MPPGSPTSTCYYLSDKINHGPKHQIVLGPFLNLYPGYIDVLKIIYSNLEKNGRM